MQLGIIRDKQAFSAAEVAREEYFFCGLSPGMLSFVYSRELYPECTSEISHGSLLTARCPNSLNWACGVTGMSGVFDNLIYIPGCLRWATDPTCRTPKQPSSRQCASTGPFPLAYPISTPSPEEAVSMATTSRMALWSSPTAGRCPATLSCGMTRMCLTPSAFWTRKANAWSLTTWCPSVQVSLVMIAPLKLSWFTYGYL